MIRVLVIDDEEIYHKMIANALKSQDYDLFFAQNGIQGLEIAKRIKPDAIITDVLMADINGFELARLLRRESEFARTPIIMLTAQTELQDKLKSFEAGADVFLTKPFAPAELLARLNILLKRAEIEKSNLIGNEAIRTPTGSGRFIAVHSLRGGIGSSSLAVNLAVGMAILWRKPAILLDLTMISGQVALMLNSTLKRTWGDIAGYTPDNLDLDALNSIICKHESGLSFIAAPTFPTETETISVDLLAEAIRLLRPNYEYIVADLSHDFDGSTMQALDFSDIILMLISPDMASIRAASAALDTYSKLNYPSEKIKLVLNTTFPKYGLNKATIESALSMPILITLPFTPDLFVQSINNGQPLILDKPSEPISGLIEDFSFHLSIDLDKKSKPENPTEAWMRVYKRFQERRKGEDNRD
jgi:pilus assembly protein CpaE